MIPQLTLIVLTCLITGIQLSKVEGATRTEKIAGLFGMLISKIVIFIILYYGDFWNPLIEVLK